MSYLSRRQSTPPIPTTCFLDARIRMARDTVGFPLKTKAEESGHSRFKNTPSEFQTCSSASSSLKPCKPTVVSRSDSLSS